MITFVLHVRHGFCARCEQPKDQDELFQVRIEPGEPFILEPIGPTTHSGFCLDCWRTGGWEIIEAIEVLTGARV